MKTKITMYGSMNEKMKPDEMGTEVQALYAILRDQLEQLGWKYNGGAYKVLFEGDSYAFETSFYDEGDE